MVSTWSTHEQQLMHHTCKLDQQKSPYQETIAASTVSTYIETNCINNQQK
jgi:hypothetical protein